MEPEVTLFSWGYWGWGTATEQLVKAVDAAEKARGFKPPIFVDIRIRRTGRAPGFVGDAFKETVGGESRYRHMQGLGNRAIVNGGPMEIDCPEDASELLDLALSSARSKRRVIFFCACEIPGTEKGTHCHRVEVAKLVWQKAQERKTPVKIVEWPGEDPQLDHVDLEVPLSVLRKIQTGLKSMPVWEESLGVMARLPWYSVVTVRAYENGAAPVRVLSGPVRYRPAGWYLPVLGTVDSDSTDAEVRDRVVHLRTKHGYFPYQPPGAKRRDLRRQTLVPAQSQGENRDGGS